MDPPEIQANRQVTNRLIDEAQGQVARGFWRQVGVAASAPVELLTAIAARITARLHGAVGAQFRVVVEALGVGQVFGVVQLIQRGRAETFAVRTAYHQFLEGLVTERVFRVGGAAKVAVFVVTHGGRQFQGVQYRYVQFGVHRLHVTVCRDAGVRVDAEAGQIVCKGCVALLVSLVAVLATDGQPGRACTKPVADFATGTAIDARHAPYRRDVLATVLAGVDQALAGCALRAERVDNAIGDPVEHG